VTENLDLSGDTTNSTVGDAPGHEAIWGIPERFSARLRLKATSFGVECDRVKVNVSEPYMSEDESNRKLIFFKREALGSKNVLDGGDAINADNEVELIVFSRLTSQ
jgi:hypothetical protein